MVKPLTEPSMPALDAPRKRAIHEWSADERPREKFMTDGGDSLQAAELLAILVGSGNAREDAVTLMQRILADCKGSLRRLGRMSIPELCAYNGIGPAKAVTILAACELGVRHAAEEVDTERLDTSEKIYRFFYPKLRHLAVEEAHVLLLNRNLRFVRSVMIGRGGIDSASVDVRVVLREALVSNAVHVAFCHNHPSGSCRPSPQDDRLTADLKRACEAVRLIFIDHIVLADGCYYSYADEGRL